MGDRPRRHDEIKGATVLLTGWSEGREREVADALGKISSTQIELDRLELPFVALPKASLEKAEAARDLLLEAGGSVDLEDAWVTRDAPRPVASRPVACKSITDPGSTSSDGEAPTCTVRTPIGSRSVPKYNPPGTTG